MASINILPLKISPSRVLKDTKSRKEFDLKLSQWRFRKEYELKKPHEQNKSDKVYRILKYVIFTILILIYIYLILIDILSGSVFLLALIGLTIIPALYILIEKFLDGVREGIETQSKGQ